MFETKPRPKIHPPRRIVDNVFASIAIISLLTGIGLAAVSWKGLPDTIPIHFNARGEADGFGPKIMLWLLPAISVVLVPAMLALRRFPWLSNTPIEITEKNAQHQYGIIVHLLSSLACVVSLLFTFLVYDTIRIANGGESLLGWGFMPIFIGGTLAPIIWYFFKAFRGR